MAASRAHYGRTGRFRSAQDRTGTFTPAIGPKSKRCLDPGRGHDVVAIRVRMSTGDITEHRLVGFIAAAPSYAMAGVATRCSFVVTADGLLESIAAICPCTRSLR